ncbi:MAG TPA: FAD-dependent thymidylate synthase [Dehalococcoidia bacterium]|nr:FAD-dependent thymidylate synthase [Dehalococcoidia bacterium]
MNNGAATETAAMTTPRIIREPQVYLVGRQDVDRTEIDRFLGDHGMNWETDTEIGGEQLIEAGGRLCYVSYGKGRKTNDEYIANIIGQKHGSVLEHAVWNFIITGVSRSFTHELIRHRAGWGYSQLSQRYVDESESAYVEPPIIAEDSELHATWQSAIETAHQAYLDLVEGLAAKLENAGTGLSKTHRRKMAREAARSVLPNATETMIFCTANARALRHFIELRGGEGAEAEIRRVAVQFLRIMQREAPNVFNDYQIINLPDGSEGTHTPNEKV